MFELTPQEFNRIKKHSSEDPDPIDIQVGKHIKMRRNLLKMSQQELATKLGITFQQVQKYENGSNRVGASRLYRIAVILFVPVTYFYEGISIDKENQPKVKDSDFFFTNPKTLVLARKIDLIEDDKFLNALMSIVEKVNPDAEQSKQQTLLF